MFQLKETEMSAQNKDLHEKYKLIENEKGDKHIMHFGQTSHWAPF